MDITTGLALQSQATRLTGGRPEVGRFGRDGALTLSGSLSQQRIAPDARGAACPGYNAAPERAGAAFHIELVPLHSPLLGESWLVSFPPLINMFKFSGSSCSSSALVWWVLCFAFCTYTYVYPVRVAPSFKENVRSTGVKALLIWECLEKSFPGASNAGAAKE